MSRINSNHPRLRQPPRIDDDTHACIPPGVGIEVTLRSPRDRADQKHRPRLKHGHAHAFDAFDVAHLPKRRSVTFSDHARLRAAQRAIKPCYVNVCRARGSVEHEAGFKGPRIVHRFAGLAVVSCARSGDVITHWWEDESKVKVLEALCERRKGGARNEHVRAMRQREKRAFHHGGGAV
tara:strand:+ start:115 stop:651 length:537 start_codon:yes stop_codon:yes gene_type:complete